MKIDYDEFVNRLREMQDTDRHEIWINGIRIFWDDIKICPYAPYETERESEGVNILFYSKEILTTEIEHLDEHCEIYLKFENDLRMINVQITDTYFLEVEEEEVMKDLCCSKCGSVMEYKGGANEEDAESGEVMIVWNLYDCSKCGHQENIDVTETTK